MYFEVKPKQENLWKDGDLCYWWQRLQGRFIFCPGQLWVCGIAGAWGIFALWRAKRCSYLGMAVGGVLLVAWGYGFVSGYLGWQALGWRVALWLLLLVAENWEGGFSYRKAYFVLALSLGVEAIVGIGQYAGLWQGNGQFRVTGTFERAIPGDRNV